MPDVAHWLQDQNKRFWPFFAAVLPSNEDQSVLAVAMRYSSLHGGKCIRPALTLGCCEALGGDAQKALPLAAALELVHCYSLAHDDLPCMDNDDYRRGQLSTHRKFGEAYALLVGDALLTLAFEVIATATLLSPEQRCSASAQLAEAAGHRGMIAGQMLDLHYEQKAVSQAKITEMNRLKTGKLFGVACGLGALAANASTEATAALASYADALGLLFQITDDLLDAEPSSNTSANPTERKASWLAILTPGQAQHLAEEYALLAQNAVQSLPNPGALSRLPEWLLARKN